MIKNMEIRGYTNQELTEKFGNNMRFEVNSCFKNSDSGGNHYYCQMDGHVLHVNEGELINKLHNSTLDDKKLIKIEKSEFDDKMKTTIFELEIYKWIEKKNV